MAYSPIEQRYIDMVVEGYFPAMPTEPAPAAEEASLEGVQLAAGPSETRTDMGEARLIKPVGAMGALKTVGEAIQSGAEKIDFDVLGLPGIGTLTLKDLTVGDLGKVLVDIAEGFPPVTGKGETLKPTMESIELINAAPAAAIAAKAGKVMAKSKKAAAVATAAPSSLASEEKK